MARIWSLLEEDGLRIDHLEHFKTAIAFPCLVIGSGQGILVDGLRSWKAGRVVAVDQSLSMALEAHKRRGVSTVVAQLPQLPFRDAAFATVLGSTGVLPCDDQDACALASSEIARVLKPGGMWLQGVFSPGDCFRLAGSQLGIMTRAAQRTDRIVELWNARSSREMSIQLISRWSACSARDAGIALKTHQPLLNVWFELFDAVQHLVGAKTQVISLFDWIVPICPKIDTIRNWFPKMVIEGEQRFEKDHVSIIAFERARTSSSTHIR
ncbi:class I SAM-dependent methyltransferase [Marivita hallyeonensis]|nr:class I SAM-dependent methyltransferase [Marivita hallyeonensis]